MDDDAAHRTLRQGWRDGSISGAALVLLFVVTVVGGLGGASIGGAGGLILTLAVLLGVIVLLMRWSEAPR